MRTIVEEVALNHLVKWASTTTADPFGPVADKVRAHRPQQHIAAVREWAAVRDLVFEGDCAAWAVFSPDRVYRYALGRTWYLEGSTAHWTMLNPSVAGVTDDPTIRRVIGLSKRRAAGVVVTNRFALVSTDPAVLLTHPDPVGRWNQDARFGTMLGYRVAAWGAMSKRLERRAGPVFPTPMWCYGKTKNGHPRHPLYLRGDTPLVSMVDGRAFP